MLDLLRSVQITESSIRTNGCAGMQSVLPLITADEIQVGVGHPRYRRQADPGLLELLFRRRVAFLDPEGLTNRFTAYAANAPEVDRADWRTLGFDFHGRQHRKYEQSCE